MPIKSIYLAGQMDNPINGWRNELVKGDLEVSLEPYVDIIDNKGFYENLVFNPLQNAVFSKYDYTGPFFFKDMRGPGDFIILEKNGNILTFEAFSEYFQTVYFNSMFKADTVFAWLDGINLFQTVVELTLANAFNKRVVISGTKYFPELWPIYSLFHQSVKIDPSFTPKTALELYLEIDEAKDIKAEVSDHLSPIEKLFLDDWFQYIYRDLGISKPRIKLKPQHEVLNRKYRLDFAHLETKVAIELDGLEAHKTTEQIANDRRRQRELEREGWRFIRFGGKEVFNDVRACVIETRNFILNLLGE